MIAQLVRYQRTGSVCLQGVRPQEGAVDERVDGRGARRCRPGLLASSRQVPTLDVLQTPLRVNVFELFLCTFRRYYRRIDKDKYRP